MARDASNPGDGAVTQTAAVNKSVELSDEDFAFWVAAANAQLEECCAAWGLPFVPVEAYRTTDGLPVDDIRVATFVDNLPEAPEAAAYHSVEDGRPVSRMIAFYGPSAFSHECCEEVVDPKCDKTVKRPDGAEVDLEVSDPVQGDTRKRSVTVMGETREVEVSNYVLPAYFDASAAGPYDAFGLVTRPFEIREGGYCVVDGNAVFARGDAVAAKAVAARTADPGSRMNRRKR